ncbi:flippase [Micavibrio aeruginosavorus]|uniref:Uncharacterized protein n=1 Tax=Micavibrio aeruginosavorus EPB TaxID=349215 RepID=M4VH26_9BACT|nr:flippase [Micavibrio aeruginosavorus]AGH97795.1 hypothetical protein A11S_975 [Micavibrio aeruginosavorus EPB]
MIFRNLAKDTVVYGGADLASKVIAFFTFPLIAAVLSPASFGTLELIVTIVGLFGLFINCGLNNATQRFYWDADTSLSERPVIVSTAFFILLFLAFVFTCAIFLTMPITIALLDRLHLPVTFYGIIAAVFLLITTQSTQFIQDVIRLHFKPVNFLIFTLLGRVLVAFSAVVAVLYFRAGVDGVLIAQALVGFAVFPIGLYLVRQDLTVKISSEWAKTLVRFGHPFIYAGLAYWLFGSMDRWMLASMSSVEEVGVYSVSYRFATIVLFASAAFGQAWSPHAIKIKSDYPESYRAVYFNVLLCLLYFMLIVGGGIALFSGEIIAFLMPDEYALSAFPLAILCFGIVLQATQQITAIGISLEKRTGILMQMAWVAAVVNLVGNWFLIPDFGAVGAAWATFISYFVLTVGYFVRSQQLHPIPVDWFKLGGVSFLGGCVLCVSLLFQSSEISLAGIVEKLLFAITCAVLGLFLLPIKEMKNVSKV